MRGPFCLILFVLFLAGCDVRTLYGIEVLDLPNDGIWNVVRKSDYTLYLTGTKDSDRPGLYLMAQSNDQSGPLWDWDDYQDWSEAKQAAAFGEYYDQKYRDVSVARISRCSYEVEYFDQRDSARELAYGRWLHDMPTPRIDDDHIKGALVRMPLAECEKRADGSQRRDAELTIIVGDRDEITITIRVEFVDAWFDWWFF